MGSMMSGRWQTMHTKFKNLWGNNQYYGNKREYSIYSHRRWMLANGILSWQHLLSFFDHYITMILLLQLTSDYDKKKQLLHYIIGVHFNTNNSVISVVRRLSTWHCPHLLLSAGAGSRQSVSPVHTALSSKPATCRCCCRSMGQTDGQTDARPFHRPCSAYYAGTVNNY